MTEDEARRWPDLMAIVEAKVKPERLTKTTARRVPEYVVAVRRDARRAVRGDPRPRPRAGHRARQPAPRRSRSCPRARSSPNSSSCSRSTSLRASRVLQSRLHEAWARFFSSSLKDDLRYTPSDCFETFPFPDGWETNAALEAAGRDYYEFRAALMVRNNEGLTKTYNRFHDPDERDPDILKLRELHAAMDRAVLDAYGWTDLQPDLRVPPRLRGRGRPRTTAASRASKKKPWRYRWPDDIRDEVLARLLALNRSRGANARVERHNSEELEERRQHAFPAGAFDMSRRRGLVGGHPQQIRGWIGAKTEDLGWRRVVRRRRPAQRWGKARQAVTTRREIVRAARRGPDVQGGVLRALEFGGQVPPVAH